MDISVELGDHSNINVVTLHKMALVYNAVQDGWNVKKRGDKYIFSKPHQNKREVMCESFLKTFLRDSVEVRKVMPDCTP